MMESDHPPQIKGVVIITLPPPDNPSLGKTITAFTLSNSSPTQTHQESQNQNNLPIQSPQNPQLQFPYPRLRLFRGVPRMLFALLGISIFALVLFSHVFPTVVEEFRRSNDDEGPESFIFPLYSKLVVPGKKDVELKLGRFVDFDKENARVSFGDRVKTQKVNKLVSSTAKVDSSAILPVRGNVYPDGYGKQSCEFLKIRVLYFLCYFTCVMKKSFYLI